MNSLEKLDMILTGPNESSVSVRPSPPDRSTEATKGVNSSQDASVRLSEGVLARYRWIVVESEILGEEIVVVTEREYLAPAREAYPDLALYFPPEVHELHPYRDHPDFIRQVHSIKKAFQGWVVPKESSLTGAMQDATTPEIERMWIARKIRESLFEDESLTCVETDGTL